MKDKLPCQTLPAWLKSNLGARCLAPLTATDSKALAAAVQIVELYAFERRPEILAAFGAVVRCMQTSCWALAFHAIAHVLDWEDRPRLWSAAGLPAIDAGRCDYEPQSRGDSR